LRNKQTKKLTKHDAFEHETSFQKGWYYQLPDVNGGTSVIYAEVSGDHGQRIIKDHARIYYIISGEGEFTVNGEVTTGKPGDVIVIPPFATYSYFTTKQLLKLVLFMDLIDLEKLPPSIKSQG